MVFGWNVVGVYILEEKVQYNDDKRRLSMSHQSFVAVEHLSEHSQLN